MINDTLITSVLICERKKKIMKISDLMKSKKDITIGYIGGSVTAGKKYSDPFTQYLKDKYPDNNINEINAGVGGTTSFLGVHRSERDLFCHKPDIVIVEFCINDGSSGKDFDYSLYGRTTEGFIKKALKTNENMLIAEFALTSVGLENEYFSKNIVNPSHEVHKKVADYYNVPYVDGATKFHELSKNDDLNTFFADGVHPNEKGGKAYCDVLIEALENYDWNIKKDVAPIYDNNFENAQLLMGEDFKNDAWKVSKCSLYGSLPNYIYCNEPGHELKVEFFGSAVGIYCTTEKDSGILEYSIDGGEWKKISTWDVYALQFNRAHNYIFECNLEKKNHTMLIKVVGEKDEDSEGRYIRIGAFMAEKTK